MSHLASVQKILNLSPIEGADKIETAEVLGWKVVVKKGEFNIGDLVCYIQIDTVVPDIPLFEFLKERKFRVKTIKLRGQLSQGLIVSLPPGRYKEGQDITEQTGVKKYEKPDTNPERYEKPRVPKVWYEKWVYYFKYNYLYKFIPRLRPKQRSSFPTHLVGITDEERIQNIPYVLEQYKGKQFVVSYKLDGSSITIIHNKDWTGSKYRICSRRFELHDKTNDWYKVFTSTEFNRHIQKLVKHFDTNDVIVQGEAIGKFNGNHHDLKKDEIRLFNIYIKGKRLTQDVFLETCMSLDIPHCPLYQVVTLNFDLKSILEFAQVKDILNPKVESEGLVFRCVEDNFSFKVINNNYLLSEK